MQNLKPIVLFVFSCIVITLVSVLVGNILNYGIIAGVNAAIMFWEIRKDKRDIWVSALLSISYALLGTALAALIIFAVKFAWLNF